MPVVEAYSDQTFGTENFHGTRGQPDYYTAAAVKKIATGSIANTATDLSGSMYRLISLDPDVILHPDTWVDLQGWGFATATIGTDADPDALLASVTVAGLGAPSSPIAPGDSRWGKRLWEQLGLTERPAGKITLSIHTAADATALGVANFEIHWLDN